jgi:hypothetical protein
VPNIFNEVNTFRNNNMKKIIFILIIVLSGMLIQAQTSQFSEKFDYVDFWNSETKHWGMNPYYDQNIVIVFNYKNNFDVYVNSSTPYTLYAVGEAKFVIDEKKTIYFIDNKGESGMYSWLPNRGIFLVSYDNGVRVRYIISDRFNKNK